MTVLYPGIEPSRSGHLDGGDANAVYRDPGMDAAIVAATDRFRRLGDR